MDEGRLFDGRMIFASLGRHRTAPEEVSIPDPWASRLVAISQTAR